MSTRRGGGHDLERLWIASRAVFYLGIAVGAYAAVARSTPAAVVMLAVVGAAAATRLAAAAVGYRRVMRRPWPKVAPLDDEDDW